MHHPVISKADILSAFRVEAEDAPRLRAGVGAAAFRRHRSVGDGVKEDAGFGEAEISTTLLEVLSTLKSNLPK